jgi:hypothetical protein
LLDHRHDTRSNVTIRLLFRHHRFHFIAQLLAVIDDTVLDDVVDTAYLFRALRLLIQADGARGIQQFEIGQRIALDAMMSAFMPSFSMPT